MRINDKEVSIEELVSDLNPRDNMIKNCGNGIYLNSEQQTILKQYGFDYEKYSNIQKLIFDIEDYLNDNYDQDIEDLESVANSLSEFNYYNNTKK